MRYTNTLLISLLMLVTAQVHAGPVDINSADAASLAAAIVGIGEKKAVSIIEYREANGPFASVEELANVKGIGSATIENNRRNLSVAPLTR